MIIDMHVHIAGKDGPGGCYMSARMQSSPAYYLMLVTTGNLFGEVNEDTIREHLLGIVEESEQVDKAVFLALDQVYDPDGTACPSRTNLHVPNSYLAGVAAHEKVLLGASVHPHRDDALDALDEAVEMGAVLCKWIPSAQDIDPAAGRHEAFYRKLAELDLPLLCHVGAEHAIPDAEGDRPGGYAILNHPYRLIPALKLGVTVIAPHCCTPVSSADPDWTDEFIDLMRTAAAEGWSLYADVSALALMAPYRMKLLKRLVRELDHDRLLLGSDYPVHVGVPLPGTGDEMDLGEWLEAVGIGNPFDRNVAVMKALGFGPQVLTNAAGVLRL
jgi:mannonate dehydratase